MKSYIKLFLLSAVCIFAVSMNAAAEELEFTPVGGGKFLYNNNPEGIDDIMTVSCDEPRYISSHEHLTPDRYYLYMSYFNYTGSGGLGYDIEVDTAITAVNDAVITIKNASFDTNHNRAYLQNGIIQNEISDWTFTNVCADMLGIDITDMSGKDVFKAHGYEPVTVHIKKGETLWLSDYFENYDIVHFGQPVHFQADITLSDGIIDINTLAKKFNGTLGDRSDIPDDIRFGIYRYDYTIKGIADTLPEVQSGILRYTIDDATEAGERLPVTIKNQYVPDGNTIYTWVSNINPVADAWSKQTSVESDMLGFKYIDDNKLSFYGSGIAKKDNIWIFDTRHAACSQYDARSNKSEAQYEPNFIIENIYQSDISTAACNLGNYGVTETYRLEIKNDGDRDRYFNYTISSKSNVIVYTSDENGTPISAYSKSMTAEPIETVMASVPIPAHETVRFNVSSQLPVNVNGGLQNSFVISDTYDLKYTKYNEKDYVDPLDGKRLSDFSSVLPQSTLDKLNGNLECYEIVDGTDSHLIRWCDWDGNPYFYSNIHGHVNTIYSLNDKYEIIAEYKMPHIATAIDIVDGIMYARDLQDGLYLSYDDGRTWNKSKSDTIPSPSFESKTVSDWAASYVRRAIAYKLVPEELQTDEKPFDEPINRRDFCYLIYSMLNSIGKSPTQTESIFSDCNDSIIGALASEGIIEGMSSTTFGPDMNITREQAAVIVSRTAEYLKIPLNAAEVKITDKISDWAVNAVYKMYNAGFMNGVGNSEFNAYGNYTKEQAVIVNLRLYDSLLG